MRLRVLVVALALGTAIPALPACDFVNTPTKVGNGQLYQSGDGRYDPWFAQVHQEQVAAASWPDESKAARKPIITALDLRPGASNSTVLSATREKKGDPGVGRAVDQTVAAERELARKLNAQQPRLERLLERGEELKKQAVEERRNMGTDKADEKKVAKKDEIKREVSAGIDALENMLTDAKRAAKEADELARKLRAAWTGKDEDEEPPRDEKKDDRDEKKDEKKEEKKEPVTKRPAPKPAEKPADDKPAPKPAQKQPDEVFNP
jgi:hypothetical protein